MRLILLDSNQNPSFVNFILRTPSPPSLPFLLCSSSVGFIFFTTHRTFPQVLFPLVPLHIHCKKIFRQYPYQLFFSSLFSFQPHLPRLHSKKHLPIVMTFRRDFIFSGHPPSCTFMTRTERSSFTPIPFSKFVHSFFSPSFRFVNN